VDGRVFLTAGTTPIEPVSHGASLVPTSVLPPAVLSLADDSQAQSEGSGMVAGEQVPAGLTAHSAGAPSSPMAPVSDSGGALAETLLVLTSAQDAATAPLANMM